MVLKWSNLRSLKPVKASPSVKLRYCITCGHPELHGKFDRKKAALMEPMNLTFMIHDDLSIFQRKVYRVST